MAESCRHYGRKRRVGLSLAAICCCSSSSPAAAFSPSRPRVNRDVLQPHHQHQPGPSSSLDRTNTLVGSTTAAFQGEHVGPRLLSAKDRWGAMATCPSGYVAVGLGSSKSASVGYLQATERHVVHDCESVVNLRHTVCCYTLCNANSTEIGTTGAQALERPRMAPWHTLSPHRHAHALACAFRLAWP